MSNDWLPDHGEEQTSAHEQSRGPLYFLIGSAVILFLVMAFVFYTVVIGQGRSLGESSPDPTPEPVAETTTTSSTSEPTEVEPTPSSEPSEEPTPARPAPEGAIEAAAFTTPASNIHCRINDANVECSIYVYDYPSKPASCEGITATYSVGAEGEASSDCQYFVKTNEVFDYGTVIAKNGFACTLEQNDGITCWSEMSGRGFNLTRTADTLF